MKFLTFFLNQHRFAVSVATTREVNRMVAIRTVPEAPAYVVGFIDLHGLITPVLNLKELIQIKPAHLAPDARWIAVKHGSLPVCLAVDQLDRIMNITAGKTDQVPPLHDHPENKYFDSYFKIDENIVPVLATGNLLTNREVGVIEGLGEHFSRLKNSQPAIRPAQIPCNGTRT